MPDDPTTVEEAVGATPDNSTRNLAQTREAERARNQRKAFTDEISQAGFERYLLEQQKKDPDLAKLEFDSKGVAGNLPEDKKMAGFRKEYENKVENASGANAADQILAIGRAAIQRLWKEAHYKPDKVNVHGKSVDKMQKIPKFNADTSKMPDGPMKKVLKDWQDSMTLTPAKPKVMDSDKRIQFKHDGEQYELGYRVGANGGLQAQVFKDGRAVNLEQNKDLKLASVALDHSLRGAIEASAPQERQAMFDDPNKISEFMHQNRDQVVQSMQDYVDPANFNNGGITGEQMAAVQGRDTPVGTVEGKAKLLQNFGTVGNNNGKMDFDSIQAPEPVTPRLG